MITPSYVRVMAAYNAEMNRRFYEAAARLSDEKRREDGGAFFKSIHGTLTHIYWADRMWLSRFGVVEKPAVPLPDSPRFVEDFDELCRLRPELDQILVDWAHGLDQSALDGDLSWYSGATQRQVTRPRALCVMHLFNHQTHHRGQVHALLTRAGEKTGDTDLAFVLPEPLPL